MRMMLRVLVNGFWVELSKEDAMQLHAQLATALYAGFSRVEEKLPVAAPAPRKK